MKHELWVKNNNIILVGVDPTNEWRYRFDGSTYYISGMSLFTLVNAGYKKLNLDWI